MTVDDFKRAFTVYNVAEYAGYHASHERVTGTGKKFVRRMTTPVDQDVVVTVDYLNNKKVPHNCALPDLYYNIYIIANRKLVVKPKPVNQSIAHGMQRFKAKAGEKYALLVVNWRDTTVNSNFTLSTYAETARAPITK